MSNTSQLPETTVPDARPTLSFGALRLRSRYLLAPLAGYTNLAFRTAVRELGGLGLATTDLISARALLTRSRKTLELIQTDACDRPLAVQIYGQDAAEMAAAAQWLEQYGASSVDINMGCPVHKVVRGGGGSAMMCRPSQTVELVRRIVESVRVPVAVKMRLGWDETDLSAPDFAREFERAGVAAVTIHGRTREQGFSGTVSLNGIRAVVEAVERIPVIGNGDVRSPADAERMLRETGCAGVAIGRGALANPWIFAQLWARERAAESVPAPSFEDRLAFLERHFQLLVTHRGEKLACLTFRKVVTWYCKALRAGHEIQQAFVRLESVAAFEGLVERIRRRGPRGPDTESLEARIPVPSGPVEHW